MPIFRKYTFIDQACKALYPHKSLYAKGQFFYLTRLPGIRMFNLFIFFYEFMDTAFQAFVKGMLIDYHRNNV